MVQHRMFSRFSPPISLARVFRLRHPSSTVKYNEADFPQKNRLIDFSRFGLQR